MSKIIRFLIVIGLFANQFLAPLQAAQAAGQQQQDTADLDAIADIVSKLNELAYFEELGQQMPFTTVSPSDEQALRLGGLFDDLAGRIAGGETSADPYPYGDVSVHVTQWPETGDLGLSFTASRVVTVPVTLSLEDPASATPGLCNDGIDNNIADPDGADQDDSDCSYIGNFLHGGVISTSLALSGTFIFSQEGSDVMTSPESVMTLTLESAESDSNIATFTDQFGFIDVVVNGSAELAETIDIQFNDPDGDGQITSDEWFNTAIEDLTTVAYRPGSSAGYSLSLEANVLPEDLEPGEIDLDIDRSVSPKWPGETTIIIPEALRVFAPQCGASCRRGSAAIPRHAFQRRVHARPADPGVGQTANRCPGYLWQDRYPAAYWGSRRRESPLLSGNYHRRAGSSCKLDARERRP
jgi:hypothetical protein